MKYARQFQDHLKNDGYPPEWINSAISYASLKKCIKRVQRELATLGLDVETLQQLLAAVEDGQGGEQGSTMAVATQEDNDDVHEEEDGHRNGSTSTACSNVSDNSTDEQQLPFQYTFSTEHSSPSRRIVPKLLFIVDAETGEPLSANLSPETRNYLHQLAVTEKLTTVRITDETDEDESSINDALNQQPQRSLRYIQIPLTTDSEFFRLLERELTRLAQLQVAERKKLSNDIHSIGNALSRAANPDSKSQRKDLTRWRQLFECYIDAKVFFATSEQDHGSRGSSQAAKNFATFLNNAQSANLLSGFKTVESAKSMEMFLNFNKELLQCLKFQEINQVAMTKILKKFDKRTALGATTNFSTVLPETPISEEFSRALSAQVATEIVSLVPQLDDYQCPICFSIAYRPVRLRCGHLFCIRCIILLQRARKTQCALCRQEVVMEATSGNLDDSLANFLERYFPEEVKAKQKETSKAVYKEQFGDEPCCIM